ncbi:low molecular weight protein arginine phosphatase [Bacillus aquiflavi]|uniref:low molecular weight protein arginine phosphatase n=1 Tax=Bacillus aquiflavi TaxID=2672567 RepID=UPI001CA9EABF|nr:low molecular weight protein arginine phosphatase [Bacillus aquiflavi]UAC47933.1 low molecular weight protein arginine phosphatase [Bacillus aquiflavi]
MIRILFVCTGNTCRSPMAEAILKSKKINGIEVRSAGVFAVEGNQSSQNTKAVLLENNIDHLHQSALLTEKQIEWATHILTMTAGHKSAIMNHFPQAVKKNFTLKEFVGEEGDIIDPFGGSIEVYRSTFTELNDYIGKIVSKLQK